MGRQERSAVPDRIHHTSFLETGRSGNGSGKIGSGEIASIEKTFRAFSFFQRAFLEIIPGKVGPLNAAAAHVGTREVAAPDIIAIEMKSRQIRADEQAVLQIRGTKFFVQVFQSGEIGANPIPA